MSYTAVLDSTNNLVSLDEVKSHCDLDTGNFQVISCVCGNAASNGGIGGKYWLFSSTIADYYVWYQVNAVGVDPAVTSRTGLEVDVATGASAEAVATATQVVIDAVAGVTATVAGSTVTVTCDTAGVVGAPTDGTLTSWTTSTLIEGTAGDVSHNNTLTDLINGASWYLNTACGRKLKAQSITEYHDGRGQSTIWLRNPTIASLTLYEDIDLQYGTDTEISSDDYILDTVTGKLHYVNNWFAWGYSVIKATYTGGFSTIPYDLRQAALWIIDWGFRQQVGQGANKDAYSNNGGSTSFRDHVPPIVSDVITMYRRLGV